jgi:prepilin-type N-terminal cleavage/methylation domain-containing protein
MILNNIRNKQRESGFTIVELLIVIVVIGILAAITIISYNGITQKANTTKAQTNAVAAQKVAEAFNADNGRYPGSIADFAAGTTAKLPAGITISGSAPTSSTQTVIQYQYIGADATHATGGELIYWDYATGAPSTNVIYVGNATSTSTGWTPAS